jgi:putative protease
VDPAPAAGLSPVKPGDGVVFDSADWRSPEEREEGGRVFEVRPEGREVTLRFANGALDSSRIRPGDLLWRTHDPDLDRVVRPYLDPAAPVRKQMIDVRVTARDGCPLESQWRLRRDRELCISVQSEGELGTARERALTVELLRDQLGRLGNTAYELGDVELVTHGQPFAPVSMLNQLRREAVERMRELQGEPRTQEIRDPATVLDSALGAIRLESAGTAGAPQVHLLVRTPEQLTAAIEVAPASITLDYLDLYGLKPSVERVKSAGLAVRVASPRVLKPGEDRVVQFLLRLECPILVRSTGLLQSLEDVPHPPLTGDFSLNAANALTADLCLRLGLDRVTPGYDLNASQVALLAGEVGPSRLEVVAYQHLPVFHTEHCVFCRFLSTGTSYRDCGRPCEKHRVEVRDE